MEIVKEMTLKQDYVYDVHIYVQIVTVSALPTQTFSAEPKASCLSSYIVPWSYHHLVTILECDLMFTSIDS